jgi:hypothetical protein
MAFPASPNIGDTHTEDDTLWTYGSNGWYSTVIGDANDTRYTCGPSIGSLNDVDLTPPPNDGDALVYDSATDSWIPGAAGATPGGSDTQIQFNDGGTALGGDADLTWNKTTNVMTVAGDVNLNDGGTYTTTLQTVTPTANRTISFPDATGTVGLVSGSSGQFTYNNAGAYAGVSTMTFDGTSVTLAGRLINSYTSVASSPAKVFTGTWFTGGTSTTTKPHFLIEPSGATSTAWSTSGTGLGVNAASGFTGNLLDVQINGTSRLALAAGGTLTTIGGGLVINSSSGVNTTGYLGSWNAGRIGFTASAAWAASVSLDTYFSRDAAGVMALRNDASAQTFRVYNTYTSGTNYELGKLEWASNVFRVGTEKGSGGGTARTVEVHTDSVARLALDTTGSVRVVTGLTVATLPGTPAVGMVARVTDATAPAVGSTVTGGGAAAALVWYNGANWSVIGV